MLIQLLYNGNKSITILFILLLHSRNIFYSILIALSFPVCINSQIIVNFNKMVITCVLRKWGYIVVFLNYKKDTHSFGIQTVYLLTIETYNAILCLMYNRTSRERRKNEKQTWKINVSFFNRIMSFFRLY